MYINNLDHLLNKLGLLLINVSKLFFCFGWCTARGCSCLSSALPLARARTAPTELGGCCLVGALQGGAVVPTAPTELLGCCLVGALQGGAAVSAAPTKLLATAWLVHLRQVHPLKLLHEQLLHLAVGCAHDVDAALQALHAYTAEGVDGYILVVVGCSERVDCCRVGVFLAEHDVYV